MRRRMNPAVRSGAPVILLLFLLFGGPLARPVQGQEDPRTRLSPEAREAIDLQAREVQARRNPEAFLKTAGVGSEPAQLVEFLTPRARLSTDKQHIRELIDQLGSEKFEERDAAERELILIGMPARDALLAATRSDDKEVAARSRRCVAEINQQEAVVVAAVMTLLKREPKAIAPFLMSKNAQVKFAAVRELGELKAAANWAVPTLVEALDDEDKRVHGETWRTLASVLGPKDFDLVLAAAKSERPAVRAGAIWVFYKFRDRGKEAVPVLLEAVHDRDPLVRQAAASALGFFPSDPRVVPALIEALADDTAPYDEKSEQTVAQRAAYSLVACWRDAEPAIPALVRAARTARKETRIAAMQTLGRIGGRNKDVAPAARAALTDALQSAEGAELRAAALSGLGLMGPAAKEAAPQIIATLRKTPPGDSYPNRVRLSALYALRESAPQDEEVVRALIEVLREKQVNSTEQCDERHTAIEALGNIGPGAKTALPLLSEAMEDKDPAIRRAAAEARGEIAR